MSDMWFTFLPFLQQCDKGLCRRYTGSMSFDFCHNACYHLITSTAFTDLYVYKPETEIIAIPLARLVSHGACAFPENLAADVSIYEYDVSGH